MWFSRQPHYVAVIAPDGVSIEPVGRRGAMDTALQCRIAPESADGWRGTLNLFALLLAEVPRGGRLSAMLSSRLVRFLTVPWSDEMLSAAGERSYLHSQFEMVFGESAHEWSFTAEALGRHKPRLACAVPRELMNGLCEAAADRKVSVVSLSPWLVHAINRHRAEMDMEGWFAGVEPGQIALAELVGGAVQQVVCGPWQRDAGLEIRRMVRRAALRSGRLGKESIWVADIARAGFEDGSDGVFSLPIERELPADGFWGCRLAGLLS